MCVRTSIHRHPEREREGPPGLIYAATSLSENLQVLSVPGGPPPPPGRKLQAPRSKGGQPRSSSSGRLLSLIARDGGKHLIFGGPYQLTEIRPGAHHLLCRLKLWLKRTWPCWGLVRGPGPRPVPRPVCFDPKAALYAIGGTHRCPKPREQSDLLLEASRCKFRLYTSHLAPWLPRERLAPSL